MWRHHCFISIAPVALTPRAWLEVAVWFTPCRKHLQGHTCPIVLRLALSMAQSLNSNNSILSLLNKVCLYGSKLRRKFGVSGNRRAYAVFSQHDELISFCRIGLTLIVTSRMYRGSPLHGIVIQKKKTIYNITLKLLLTLSQSMVILMRSLHSLVDMVMILTHQLLLDARNGW